VPLQYCNHKVALGLAELAEQPPTGERHQGKTTRRRSPRSRIAEKVPAVELENLIDLQLFSGNQEQAVNKVESKIEVLAR
jgi:hypothetical protein